MDTERFREAVRRIDAANADDPHTLTVDGRLQPKELTHAAMVSAWVARIQPEASESLLLAARAHHIRRWTILREDYPSGRGGYLRWRTALQAMHAEEVGRILGQVGYTTGEITRVQRLVRKFNLKRDVEAQTLEDGLCLVFLETQLSDLRARYPAGKISEIIQKTWRKMSPSGREIALSLPLPLEEITAVEDALAEEGDAY